MKPKMAHKISAEICSNPNCGCVHIALWRDGKIFAEAVPVTLETADLLAKDILEAAAEIRARKGKPHVH